jgi:hypothetical protein
MGWDFVKIKNICSAKGTEKNIKNQPLGRKYLQVTYSTRDLNGELLKLKNDEISNSVKNGPNLYETSILLKEER